MHLVFEKQANLFSFQIAHYAACWHSQIKKKTQPLLHVWGIHSHTDAGLNPAETRDFTKTRVTYLLTDDNFLNEGYEMRPSEIVVSVTLY